MSDEAKDPRIENIMSQPCSVTEADVVKLQDYTLLNPKASKEELDSFAKRAAQYPVAAVCIYAHHLPLFAELSCKKASVVNFPLGQQTDESVIAQIKAICKTYIVDEIDYVFPLHTYLCKGELAALNQSKAVIETCHENGTTVKVILESGAFADLSRLRLLAEQVIEQGCDFLKTSTGHYSVGATLSAADVMLQAIVNSGTMCGMKVSGGIKDIEQAQQYIKLAEYHMGKPMQAEYFRIGASRLLCNVGST